MDTVLLGRCNGVNFMVDSDVLCCGDMASKNEENNVREIGTIDKTERIYIKTREKIVSYCNCIVCKICMLQTQPHIYGRGMRSVIGIDHHPPQYFFIKDIFSTIYRWIFFCFCSSLVRKTCVAQMERCLFIDYASWKDLAHQFFRFIQKHCISFCQIRFEW